MIDARLRLYTRAFGYEGVRSVVELEVTGDPVDADVSCHQPVAKAILEDVAEVPNFAFVASDLGHVVLLMDGIEGTVIDPGIKHGNGHGRRLPKVRYRVRQEQPLA